ncbi:GDSL-like lipase/acylhydrolase family protein [Motilibacter rhizosphaerae]|uniref:GDSL-like lipase/acylhydrolase family protein n=1 Tax=Motilibacter rhizosphaerae TaxID=598652 RepID=A0A4Q7NB91_9ACTN|nr:GDSL-type esterase/lipase family protein [Motilibacter rhizosphaerae]RZS80169.1 GDSL-like lipase/acylhydrolase family protein [Motilibacter rhizosphaerae]
MALRRSLLPVVAALLLPTAYAVPAGAAARPTAPAPASIAVLGDSISRGFDACGFLQDCPAVSWSTGTSPAVHSHASRLAALRHGVRAYNDAATGSTASDLPAQAARAHAQRAAYVEVLIGANDACAPSVDQMTPVADFQRDVTAGFAKIASSRVFVASIPDVYALWKAAHGVADARSTWSTWRLCQSLLARPASTAPADEARRKAVRARVVAYNAVLRKACAALPHCRTDGGAVFAAGVKRSELSTIDWFHPNPSGQAALAARTWARTWSFR